MTITMQSYWHFFQVRKHVCVLTLNLIVKRFRIQPIRIVNAWKQIFYFFLANYYHGKALE